MPNTNQIAQLDDETLQMLQEMRKNMPLLGVEHVGNEATNSQPGTEISVPKAANDESLTSGFNNAVEGVTQDMEQNLEVAPKIPTNSVEYEVPGQ